MIGTALYSGYFCKNKTVHWESVEIPHVFENKLLDFLFLFVNLCDKEYNSATTRQLLTQEFGMWKTSFIIPAYDLFSLMYF